MRVLSKTAAKSIACLSLALAGTLAQAAEVPATTTPVPAPAVEDGIRPATTGFYPIWENTGYVQPHREIYLSTQGAQFGIGNVAHIGLNPINFLYRTPNLYGKLSVYEGGRWNGALQVGMYQVQDEASRAFLSPMYTSRLDNPDYSVNLLPVSFAASYKLRDWLVVHQNATALGIWSNGPVSTDVVPGYSIVGEFVARKRHSVNLHLTEVGFWRQDFYAMGASYRYQNSWMEFRLGYFYRVRTTSQESAPLIGFGVLL